MVWRQRQCMCMWRKVPPSSFNAWCLFALLLQSQTVWRVKVLSQVLTIVCCCYIATPLLLSSAISQIFLFGRVKSHHSSHLSLQSLTPYFSVSIKTLEHCAGFGFEVFCAFVWTAEPAFCYVTSSIAFPREAGKTSSGSALFILTDIVMKVRC